MLFRSCQNDLLLLDSNILNIFQITLHPGGTEDENFDVVECFGFIGDACRMDVMVGAIYIQITLSHIKLLAGL